MEVISSSAIAKETYVMEDWRKLVWNNGNGNAAADDIFEMIQRAIMVAASDYPLEFQIKRLNIAKALFSDDLIHHIQQNNNIACKDKKMNLSQSQNNHHPIVNNHHINYGTSTSTSSSHQETEMIIDEVLRIKQILDRDESESVDDDVYDLLSKLEQMGLSYNTLYVTKVGRSVTAFKNHGSSDVRLIARRLVKMWKGVADQWVQNQEEKEKEQKKEKEKEKEKEEKKEKEKEEQKEKEKEEKKEKEKKQMDCIGMIKKESSTTTRCHVLKIKLTKRDSEKKAVNIQEKSTTCINIEKKFEATKRKLHQRYEEVENAKRQRKIQVVELHQLPKAITQNKKSLKKW